MTTQVMKLQSIGPNGLDMPDGRGGRILIQPGDIFEADEQTAQRLISNRLVIEIVDDQAGPTLAIRYIGLGVSRWIPALHRSLPRGERCEVPLWLGRFLLSQEPGNFQEA